MSDVKIIAILGANGQIGKSLICQLHEEFKLQLFVRKIEDVSSFLKRRFSNSDDFDVCDLKEFGFGRYDVIINAAGPGDPSEQRKSNSNILDVSEKLDRMVLDYLDQFPQTSYIYFSTGAVYDGAYKQAVDENSVFSVSVDKLEGPQLYALAKLAAEARHRARSHNKIADIRLFGYISPFLDMQGSFFLSEVLKAVVQKTTFQTTPSDFVRDFVGPQETADLIRCLIKNNVPNGAYDLYSRMPVTKYEMINGFADSLSFKFEMVEADTEYKAVTKPSCISLRLQSRQIGYAPKWNSLEIVVRELKEALAWNTQ